MATAPRSRLPLRDGGSSRAGTARGRSGGRGLTERGAILILIVISFALYARSVGFGFVHADDTDLIAGNAEFLSDLSNLPRAFGQSYFESAGVLTDLKTYYRPLTVASFILDAQVAGSNPAVYHFTNVVLHGLVAALLFLVLRRLGSAPIAALLASLVFAVHPANVSTVCWVMGRNELLLAAFGLASLAGSIAFRRDGGRLALALHVVAFAGALFSKESGLAVFPLVLLHALFWDREGRTRLAWLAALDIGVVVVWWWMRSLALSGGAPTQDAAWWRTLVTNTPQVLVYLEKALFPFRLNTMPGVDRAAIVLGLVSGSTLIVWMTRLHGHRRSGFIAAWFIAFLAPGLLVPGLPAYEHRLYVPLLGIAMGFSALGLGSGSWRKPGRWHGAAAIVAVFAISSFGYSGTFRDPLTYWGRATQGSPYAPIAHVNVGQILQDGGNPQEAALHFRRAIELDPRTPRAHNNLGVALMHLDRPREALVEFEREVALHPSAADAHYNIGLYYQGEGNLDEAVTSWERAIRANRYYLPAYTQLADHYAARGERTKAEQYARQAREISAGGRGASSVRSDR